MKYRNSVKFERKWISDEEFFTDADLLGEIWRPFDTIQNIKLSCTHEVSNKGRVRRITGELNRGDITYDGYHRMHFSTPNTNGIDISVHTLVLTIFRGSPPDNMDNPTVQHINHDKLDNRIENLCWMSAFENNQEGHGRQIKLIDEFGEHVFASQKVASSYINRYEDYISECIRNGYKITRSADKKEITAYFMSDDGSWQLYCPSANRNRTRCKLIISEECYTFDSFFECDKFLNKPKGYVSNVIMNRWPILDKPHQFFIFNRDCNNYILYCPTAKKHRNHANPCKISYDHHDKIFPSIAKAAEYIGRDSEYLRIKLKENKEIKDCNGQIVHAQLVDCE